MESVVVVFQFSIGDAYYGTVSTVIPSLIDSFNSLLEMREDVQQIHSGEVHG